MKNNQLGDSYTLKVKKETTRNDIIIPALLGLACGIAIGILVLN